MAVTAVELLVPALIPWQAHVARQDQLANKPASG
jgi:hypothetical protein